jgi:CubicO group peptidase (beta-lactamase class C family)
MQRGAMRGLVAGVCVGLALLAPGAPGQDAAGVEVEDLTPQVEDRRNQARIPGLAAAVVRRGELAGLGAAGAQIMGEAPRVGVDDRFFIGACTQAFTATLAAILVEEGALRWDVTVGETFPEFGDKIVEQYKDVTLEQLLRHRSGMPEMYALNKLYSDVFRKIEGDPLEARRTAARYALTLRPTSEPGLSMTFNVLGYVVAGAIIEAETGRPWEALIREKIFERLGMASAGFGPPGPGEPRGHYAAQPAASPAPIDSDFGYPPVVAPAAGIHCSMADWAKFVGEVLRGARGDESRLLGAEAWDELLRIRNRERYAMGWFVEARPWAGGRALNHTTFNGFWHATVWIAPERDMAILVAANASASATKRACDQMVATLVRSRPGDGG